MTLLLNSININILKLMPVHQICKIVVVNDIEAVIWHYSEDLNTIHLKKGVISILDFTCSVSITAIELLNGLVFKPPFEDQTCLV